MSISETEVRTLVDEFLSSQDLKGFRYEFVNLNASKICQDEIGAVYNLFSSEGSPIDGPVVFVIDKNSKKVRFL